MEIKPNHKIKACKQNWMVKINLQGDERCLIAVTLHKQMKFSIKGFFSKCDQSTGNCGLVIFIEEILEWKTTFSVQC